MKYRSYNSELLIATTLMCDVFNDIIIDRRKHGMQRDYSKPITLKDIVQQKIEVPCVLGDRGVILKSLENAPGRYKLPLIIIQTKGIRGDASRVCDLHADVFFQRDSESFLDLDTDKRTKLEHEISKKRGKPITISYDVTFVTKYREDLDQLISNFAVHFQPDIYLKWYHPRIKTKLITSQLLWDQNVSFDQNVDYNPQNIHVYKGSTTFTFKSWLFFGMHATDNAIDPSLEPIIKKIKIFPDRTGSDGEGDENNDDDIWAFGDLEEGKLISTIPSSNLQTINKGTFGFYGIASDQEMTSTNIDDILESGKYFANNIYAKNYAAISGDPVLSKIYANKLAGDLFTVDDKYNFNNYKKYSAYFNLDLEHSNTGLKSIINNIYFKGGFNEDDMTADPPSGDFLFRKFFKRKTLEDGTILSAEFGKNFCDINDVHVDYNVKTKDFTIFSNSDNNAYSTYMKSKFNSNGICFQEFEIKSKKVTELVDQIWYSFHSEYDKDFKKIEENSFKEFNGVTSISDTFKEFTPNFYIEEEQNVSTRVKIKNIIDANWNSLDLTENDNSTYTIKFTNKNAISMIKENNLDDINFQTLKFIGQAYYENYYYYILANNYIYIIMKVDVNDENKCDIYDFGIMFPFKYESGNGMLYQVDQENSKELLGMCFYLGI